MDFNNKIIVYTDGACTGNPGPGGWGALIILDNNENKISGFDNKTTNNRMELKAAIYALKYIKESSEIILYTDSTYVKNGITNWIGNWKKNDWKTKNKKQVKNSDLWIALDLLNNFHSVEWLWVKGHSGDRGNEIADELARTAIINNSKA